MAPYLVVWGYIGIYRRKKYVGGATWAPQWWRARLGGVGAPPYLMPSWITFGTLIIWYVGGLVLGCCPYLDKHPTYG